MRLRCLKATYSKMQKKSWSAKFGNLPDQTTGTHLAIHCLIKLCITAPLSELKQHHVVRKVPTFHCGVTSLQLRFWSSNHPCPIQSLLSQNESTSILRHLEILQHNVSAFWINVCVLYVCVLSPIVGKEEKKERRSIQLCLNHYWHLENRSR